MVNMGKDWYNWYRLFSQVLRRTCVGQCKGSFRILSWCNAVRYHVTLPSLLFMNIIWFIRLYICLPCFFLTGSACKAPGHPYHPPPQESPLGETTIHVETAPLPEGKTLGTHSAFSFFDQWFRSHTTLQLLWSVLISESQEYIDI